MLTKRATLGLNVILLIAGTPSHRTITADTLASMTDVCLSYIEGILKEAREQGLIRATRGPGGGYQLVVSLGQLSVWDVVVCFNPKNASLPKNHSSPESRATNFIAENAEQFEKEFLQNYPLAQLVPQNAVFSDSKPTKSLAMNFKPLPIRARPLRLIQFLTYRIF
ncbi:MAG: Rrf2 family transcriptional regulator [Betaproteobacteria bacterium]|nr:Rrf2 family transcriptional regulator [Betaproteobacteria bacterium]